MYINTVMKYQLHQGYMFRLCISNHQANAEHILGRSPRVHTHTQDTFDHIQCK